ncbi:hypothetical protein [Halomonas elongata]|nr:hypothetical protein [Halomonas elongata]WBF17813.1 hypothetical protein LM502_17375 [Halomonas elongata]WPU46658.1 hypothetical protein SR933_15625 [Halomonas elongata DSM 2581]
MATYADMQDALKRYQSAQHEYYAELERELLETVKGYAAHLGLTDQRASVAGKACPMVSTGRVTATDTFEPMESQEAWLMRDAVFSTCIGIMIRESDNAINGSWVALKAILERSGDSYHYTFGAYHDPAAGFIEARVFKDGSRQEVYEAMSTMVMKVLDPAPFEN